MTQRRSGSPPADRRLPVPEREELIMLLEECTMRRVAEHYGVTPPTLYNWMRKLKIAKRGKLSKSPRTQEGA